MSTRRPNPAGPSMWREQVFGARWQRCPTPSAFHVFCRRRRCVPLPPTPPAYQKGKLIASRTNELSPFARPYGHDSSHHPSCSSSHSLFCPGALSFHIISRKKKDHALNPSVCGGNGLNIFSYHHIGWLAYSSSCQQRVKLPFSLLLLLLLSFWPRH